MKVTKTTWVDVGQGSAQDIANALRDTRLPDHAHAVELSINRKVAENSGIFVNFVHQTQIKFEWISEE
jgi:hypothetical protein